MRLSVAGDRLSAGSLPDTDPCKIDFTGHRPPATDHHEQQSDRQNRLWLSNRF